LLVQFAAVLLNPHGRESLDQVLVQAGVSAAQRPSVLLIDGIISTLLLVVPAVLHSIAFYGLLGMRRGGWVVAFLLACAWSIVLIYMLVGAAYRLSLMGAFTAPLVSIIQIFALLAPLVFLGEDQTAKRLYTTIASDDIYRPRSGLELLFANSLTDTAPLRDKVQGIVTDDFVARIAAEGQKGRVLAIQAVELDAGESVVFDLTAIAQRKNFPVCARMSPRECIINALLAASAMPVAFPPVFIDSEMYVDGGLRQHGFTINLINGALHSPTATARSLDNPEGFALRLPSTPDPEAASVNLTLIANTDLEYPLTCTGNGLREIAERAAVIMIDQLAVGSFFRLLAETQSHPGSSAKFTYADPALTQCELGQSDAESLTGTFKPEYMRCLYRAGCSLAATGAELWHTQPTDLPHSPIARHPASAANLRPLTLNAPAICLVGE